MVNKRTLHLRFQQPPKELAAALPFLDRKPVPASGAMVEDQTDQAGERELQHMLPLTVRKGDCGCCGQVWLFDAQQLGRCTSLGLTDFGAGTRAVCRV